MGTRFLLVDTLVEVTPDHAIDGTFIKPSAWARLEILIGGAGIAAAYAICKDANGKVQPADAKVPPAWFTHSVSCQDPRLWQTVNALRFRNLVDR